MVPELALDLGLGWAGQDDLGPLGRLRVGVLRVDARDLGHPTFLSLGAFVGHFSPFGGLGATSFGVEAETMSLLWGLSAGAGVGLALDGRFTAHASVGWSIFLVEGQARWDGAERHDAVILKMRLPIGVMLWGLGLTP
jgi:hypothetical protein